MASILHFFQAIVTLNGAFHWDTVWQFLFSSFIFKGIIITILLSVLAQIIGTLIGLLLYLMRQATGPIRVVAEIYVTFFRGTPLLVQIFFLYNLIPYLNLVHALQAVPIFDTLGFGPASGNYVPFDSFLAALIGLSFNEGAYMAEIVRAGVDSIDVGQMEAAKSLGMPYGLAMRRIILPQAARVIIPPLGNEFNNMLKSSALAYVTAASELFRVAENISSATFRPLELFVVASFWYLVMTNLWGLVQSYLERRFNPSGTSTPRPSFLNRLLGRAPRDATPALAGTTNR
jgi:polar amino acid transport system permease protein